MERIDHASGFTSCLVSQDVADEKAQIIETEIYNLFSTWEAIMTGVEEFAIGINDADWNDLLTHEKLAGTVFFWNELRDNASRKMEPKLEKLASQLAVDGYHGWNRLYSKIAGDLKAEFEEDGKKEMLSMGQLANKFSSADRNIRRQAFEKLEGTWDTVSPVAAMALNSQAGFRLSMYKGRDWDSALHEPLLLGRLKEKSIEAMWSAVANGGKQMLRYIEAKKKLLKIDKFRWYDQLAPVGNVSLSYSYDEAGDFVVKHLGSFSKEIGDFARMAIDNRWIEAEDRPGKRAGGFCTGLDLKKESRIFMTFSGGYDEMMTLAHELGHAYHSYVLKDHDYFSRHYPMNLAETASTFNELLVTDAALNSIDSKEEKLALLDQKIQQGFIMFCNIRARFIFDSNFYKERKKGTVPRERLSELMCEAQKTAFGDILSGDGLHPLFWASKLHFFETEMPFYNFPYTFGFLFAGGIYDLAKKEGPAFADKYRSLLADTGSMTTDDVARKHIGVDLSGDTFWNRSLNWPRSWPPSNWKLHQELTGRDRW